MSARSQYERRATLIELQRLLTEAEARIGADPSRMTTSLEDVAEAFERFRGEHHDAQGDEGPWTATGHARRSALRALAAAIAEIDDSSFPRDSERIRAALDVAKQAAEVCERLETPTQASGLRRRLSDPPDEMAVAQENKKR